MCRYLFVRTCYLPIIRFFRKNIILFITLQFLNRYLAKVHIPTYLPILSCLLLQLFKEYFQCEVEFLQNHLEMTYLIIAPIILTEYQSEIFFLALIDYLINYWPNLFLKFISLKEILQQVPIHNINDSFSFLTIL